MHYKVHHRDVHNIGCINGTIRTSDNKLRRIEELQLSSRSLSFLKFGRVPPWIGTKSIVTVNGHVCFRLVRSLITQDI